MAKFRFITDNNLSYAINDLIIGSKKTLVFVYPILSKIEHILDKIKDLREKKDVKIYFVTRRHDKDESHNNSIQFLRNLGCNIFMDDLVNSRIIISDEAEMLLSSADLSRTSNDREYDSGIITNDRGIISKTLDYVEKLMQIIDRRIRKK